MATALGSPSAATAYGERHEEFRTRLREFASRWSRADVDDWERRGRLPRAALTELCEAGFVRERWAEGRTAGVPFGAVMAEELALVCGGLTLGATLHCETFLSTLEWLAKKPAHQELLEDALDGRAIGCFALTEPSGGSDIAAVRTVARRVDGQLHLSGEKRFISNVKCATHTIVVAATESERPGHCLVIVPLDAEGVEIAGSYPTMGVHSCDTGHLRFDARLPEDALLGSYGGGLMYVHHALQLERIAISAQLLSGARAGFGLAVAHARQRRIFDRRVMDFQALRHRMADVQSELWAAEAFLHRVLVDTAAGRQTGRQSAALKLTAARTAAHAVDESIQFLGGRGFTSNYPLERWWRDARVSRIGAGTDEVMRELVASAVDRPDKRFEAWREELDADDLPIPWED